MRARSIPKAATASPAAAEASFGWEFPIAAAEERTSESTAWSMIPAEEETRTTESKAAAETRMRTSEALRLEEWESLTSAEARRPAGEERPESPEEALPEWLEAVRRGWPEEALPEKRESPAEAMLCLSPEMRSASATTLL